MGYEAIFGMDHGSTSTTASVGTVAPVLFANIETGLRGYIGGTSPKSTRYKNRGYLYTGNNAGAGSFEAGYTLPMPYSRVKFGANVFGLKLIGVTGNGVIFGLGYPSVAFSNNTGDIAKGGGPNGIGAYQIGHIWPTANWCSIQVDVTGYDWWIYVDGDLAYHVIDPYNHTYTWTNPTAEQRKTTFVRLSAAAIDDFWVMSDEADAYEMPLAGSIIKTLRPSTDVTAEWTITGTGTSSEVLAGESIDDVNYLSTQYSDKHAESNVTDPFSTPPLSTVNVVQQSVWSGSVIDGGVSSYRMRVSNGVTNVNSAALYTPTSSAYERARLIHETNPIDSSVWTDGDADSLIWGIKSE